MKSHKQWLLTSFAFTILIYSLLMGFSYVIDPFRLFHSEGNFQLTTYFDGMYYGKIKNYTYDSLLVGKSTVKFYDVKLLDKKFNSSFLSLACPGCYSYDYKLLLDHAFKFRQNIKTVVYELGFDIFSGDEHLSSLHAAYLYKYNFLIASLKYLSNSSILNQSMNVFISLITKSDYATQVTAGVLYGRYDNAHLKFYDPNLYSYKSTLDTFESLTKHTNLYVKDDEFPLNAMKDNFEKNLLNIVKNNKNTKFIFIYPPYSILHHVYLKEYHPTVYKNINDLNCYVNNVLSQYNNVEIYDFQNETTITTELSNYLDLHHFSKKIADYVIDNIRNDKYLTGKCSN